MGFRGTHRLGPTAALYFPYNNPIGTPKGPDIGRMTTDGSFQLFPLSSSAQPVGITNGPGNAVWYTDASQNQIGKVTPTGTVTTFGTSLTPEAITEGPDGNLWFTESGKLPQGSFSGFLAIGQMTPDGEGDRLPLPDAQSGPRHGRDDHRRPEQHPLVHRAFQQQDR